MSEQERISLLYLWDPQHPRDFVRRVENLLTDLYERVEALEYDAHQMEGKVKDMDKVNRGLRNK